MCLSSPTTHPLTPSHRLCPLGTISYHFRPLADSLIFNARAPPKQLSSLTNRNHLVPSSTSARMTATPQTSLTLSTPIIHSNGKPLKHSLKSSHSSPHIPGVRLHQRAQAEPAMSAGGPVKNVHFAGNESLRTVRVFNAFGKPVNGSKQQAADETETETEYDSPSVPNELTSFPLPIMSLSSNESDPAFQLDSMRCSSVPSTNLPVRQRPL